VSGRKCFNAVTILYRVRLIYLIFLVTCRDIFFRFKEISLVKKSAKKKQNIWIFFFLLLSQGEIKNLEWFFFFLSLSQKAKQFFLIIFFHLVTFTRRKKIVENNLYINVHELINIHIISWWPSNHIFLASGGLRPVRRDCLIHVIGIIQNIFFSLSYILSKSQGENYFFELFK